MRALRGVFVLVLALALSVPVLAADFEAGLAAFDRGDYETALEEWRPLAEQGDADAQYYLGNMYTSGWGVPRDLAEAAYWYGMAAAQEHAEAQFSLGDSYDHGDIPRDLAEAAKWYRKAADQGHADAMVMLGLMYQAGRGVPQDDAEAAKWLDRAKKSDIAQAALLPGTLWEAADLIVGENAFEKGDYVKAARQFRIAAEKNDGWSVIAQFYLGDMYYNGHGVPQDYSEAVKWYRMAAEQGNADAQSALGVMYQDGRGVPRDFVEAARWYDKAAEQGDESAGRALTRSYPVACWRDAQ